MSSRNASEGRRKPSTVAPTTVNLTEKHLRDWIAREIKHMRLTYMDTHGIETDELFANHAGVTVKTLYNLEKPIYLPGIDTLNKLCEACDTNLAEFFSKLVTRADMLAIDQLKKDDSKTMRQIMYGLSNPRTRKVIQGCADTVTEFLSLIASE